MKPIQFIALGLSFILGYQNMVSQNIQRSVISCTGATLGIKGKYYSQTVGQPSNTVIFTNQVYLYQGFQQSHKWKLNSENLTWSYQVEIYPNPFVQHINIKLARLEDGLVFKLFDNQGKEVMKQQISATHMIIDTRKLPYGLYTIVIVLGNKSLKYFHAIKVER